MDVDAVVTWTFKVRLSGDGFAEWAPTLAEEAAQQAAVGESRGTVWVCHEVVQESGGPIGHTVRSSSDWPVPDRNDGRVLARADFTCSDPQVESVQAPCAAAPPRGNRFPKRNTRTC